MMGLIRRYKSPLTLIISILLAAATVTGCATGGSGGESSHHTGKNFGVGHWNELVKVDMTDRSPTVQKSSVRLAQAPFWDHSIQEIGMRKGWYQDVGINPKPKPHGVVLTMKQMGPTLLSGNLDIGTMVPQSWATALDRGAPGKVFTYRDVFMGHAFLAKPGAGYVSVEKLLSRGVSWKSALQRAVQQLKGKTVYITDEPSSRDFRETVLQVAGVPQSSFTQRVVSDTTIQQLAASGKAEIVQPVSLPVTVQLMARGWVPIVITKDLVQHGNVPGIQSAIVNTGLAATADWLRSNPYLALRAASVDYRILQFKKKHPEEAAKIQMPFLNSVAGTKLTLSDRKLLDDVFDKFYTFDEQTAFFTDKNSPVYWKALLNADIHSLQHQGILKKNHKPGEVAWAASTWKTLRSLRDAAQKRIDYVHKKSQERTLSDATESYYKKAKKFYDAFDYLDALRFANAAKLRVDS